MLLGNRCQLRRSQLFEEQCGMTLLSNVERRAFIRANLSEAGSAEVTLCNAFSHAVHLPTLLFEERFAYKEASARKHKLDEPTFS